MSVGEDTDQHANEGREENTCAEQRLGGGSRRQTTACEEDPATFRRFGKLQFYKLGTHSRGDQPKSRGFLQEKRTWEKTEVKSAQPNFTQGMKIVPAPVREPGSV